jgi:hypothetical protein
MKKPVNAGQPYTDEAIKLVLLSPRTEEFKQYWSVVLGRSEDAIQMIWKQAAKSARGRKKLGSSPENIFVRQVSRIKAELGLTS